MPEDLTREPGWPYSTMHFTHQPKENPVSPTYSKLRRAWLAGALVGLYALYLFAYDPRSGPAGLERILLWTTGFALVATTCAMVLVVLRQILGGRRAR